MKTKQIPAIIMLIAGFITCIVGIFKQFEAGRFLEILLLVLVIFYSLGCIVKLILDKNFREMEEPADEEQSEEENEEEKVTEDEDFQE